MSPTLPLPTLPLPTLPLPTLPLPTLPLPTLQVGGWGQLFHCTHFTVLTLLYSLYCTHFTVLTLLYSLYCTHHTVLTMLYSFYYTHHTVLTILYSPYCTHHTVLTILYSLYRWVDGISQEARLNKPTAIACLTDGSLLVSDTGNNCLRFIHPNVRRGSQVSLRFG
jgi:hypothetical protein